MWINLENLKYLGYTELDKDRILADITSLVNDIYYTYEPDQVRRLFFQLERLISEHDKEVGLDWDKRENYLSLLKILKFGLVSKESDLIDSLKDNFVFLSSLESDLKGRIQYYIFLFGDYDGSLRREILGILSQSNEKLGQATIKDWIKDYNISLSDVGQRSNLSQVAYINKSSLIKGLSEIEVETVRNLINLYDWLVLGGILPSGLIIPTSKLSNLSRKFEKLGLPQNKAIEKKEIYKKDGLVDKPIVIKKTQPAFLFDEEDEKEADKYRRTNQESQITEEKTLEERLREYAKEVVTTNNLSFKDEINARRFELLFVSRLKEVRSGIEVKESLMKPVVSGGLGLSEVVAEKVASIIEVAKKNFESPIANRQSPIAKSSSGKKEIDKLIAAELPVVLPKKPIALPLSSQFKEPVKPVVNKIQPQVKPVKDAVKEKLSDTEIDRQKVLQELARTAAAAAVSKTVSLPQNKTKPVFQPKPKPQLNDVRAPSKTLGPLDELRVLNLVDFRRLAPKPIEALRKIQSKIELIGETSIGKRIEAIRSWQSSEVYRNYLSLGRLSIEQGKPVSQIIAEQSQNGQPCLNEEEFQSIVDLNEKLRF